jgi:hypothetical protein
VRALFVVALLVTATAEAEPTVLVTDPLVLRSLEQSGLDFGSVIADTPQATNAALAGKPRWRAIADVIRADVAAHKRKDPAAGVGVAGNAHRLFDVRWLSAETARFELVGVVNRMDRAALHGGCGETRLVYRLRYRTPAVTSRLPMTVQVELHNGDDCRAVAKRWETTPLSFAPLRVRQIAVNYQIVRWPSAVRPDLGGHAEYVLRAFHPDGRVRKLENTPISGKKSALVAWVRANAAGVDEGTAILPDELSAEKTTSVSPHGFARLANQPFRRELSAADLAGLPFPGEQLLTRLDESSCAGCHQSRAVAGFHLLGVDGPEEAAGNALAVAASPHVTGDLARRRAWVEAILAGTPPSRRQPLASRTNPVGLSGEKCPCADGLACVRGFCQSDPPEVGESCEPLVFSKHGERASRGRVTPCARGMVCEATSVGFPGGMCAGDCDPSVPHGTCGAIAILSDFNNCLARRTPFPTCLASHTRPALLRACSDTAPCREDYICARTGSGAGACIPPYFLFQMRVDGHPK